MSKQLSLFNQEPKNPRRVAEADSAYEAWTLEDIKAKLREIEQKGFISIPDLSYRSDDGAVGQILEREFNVSENNLSVRDLGTFELKGMRRRSSTLTLCHKTTSDGLNPLQLFDRFSYVRPSNRDSNILKRKLFTTIDGIRPNSLGLVLSSSGSSSFALYYQEGTPDNRELLSKWDIEDCISKIDSVILVFADTQGKLNAKDEHFHYVEAWLLNGLKPISELIADGKIKVDLCIDQAIDRVKGPHDRGPHIRIPKRRLISAYTYAERIM